MTVPNFRKFFCFLVNVVDVTFNRGSLDLTVQVMTTYSVTLIHWISQVGHQKVVSHFHQVLIMYFKVTIY